MKVYRDLAEKTPSFRERSETTDLIVDITLQPWRAFQPDGVILFSDILTPLPAIGIPFEIDDYKGPLLDKTIRSEEDLKMMHSMDYGKVPFIEESLKLLRSEIGDTATLLGFVGAPWKTSCIIKVTAQLGCRDTGSRGTPGVSDTQYYSPEKVSRTPRPENTGTSFYFTEI